MSAHLALSFLLTCGLLVSAGAAKADLQLPDEPAFEADVQLAQSPEPSPGEKVKPDIWYVPTPQRLVDVMLLMAEVKKDDLLYDLGSGDGRLVITAAKRYGTRGIGIDIDPAMIAEANRNAVAMKVQDKVEFRQQDLFKSDFKDATVITLYLLDALNVRLRPQIFAQVKPGTRIVSHAFRMGEWEPDVERSVKIKETSYDAFFWVVPANISGTWQVSSDSGVKGIPEKLVVEQTFQRFAVRDSASGAALGEGSLAGNEFVLTMNIAGAGKRDTYTGTIEGDRIKGRRSGKSGSWTAQRERGTEKPIDAPPAVSPAPEP